MPADDPPREEPRRDDPHRERADRILDAAAQLMRRHGYGKATVKDVAEAAGVGKHTVYLHWTSRQALFLDVLRREAVASVDELAAAVRADPEMARLHLLARKRYSGVLVRPLLRAFHAGDSDVLGGLTRESVATRDPAHRAAFEAYVRLLSDNGLLYGSFDVQQIAAAHHAVFHGFLTVTSYSGGGPESRSGLLAATLRRAFEPTSPMPVPPAVAAETARLFAASADADRAMLRRAFQ